MRSVPEYPIKMMGDLFEKSKKRGLLADNEHIFMLNAPHSGAEFCLVLIETDDDGDFKRFIGHDLDESALGSVFYEVANFFEPKYIFDDMLKFYQGVNPMPGWIVKQALESLDEKKNRN